jgi:two-component system LytT family response regulator
MTTEAAPLRVIIVDDEPLARQRLRDLLDEAGGIDLVAECTDGTTVLDAVAATRPDVALLDVRMPGRDGIGVTDLLRALGDDGPVVVFTTAHAKPALDLRTTNYLLKPYSAERLATVLDRAREVLRARQADHLAALCSRSLSSGR